MNEILLNLIPNDLLNLIFAHIRPSIKYSINKTFFVLFYKHRLLLINKNYNLLKHSKIISNYNYYHMLNHNYIKYLTKNDCLMMIEIIIKNNFNNNLFLNKIISDNIIFQNIIDFILFYSKKYNSYKIYNYINTIIKKYNLTHLIKKEHKHYCKNNNRNNKWKI